MAWYYIKGRWWIFVIATVPFLLLGIVFIWLHFSTTMHMHRPWYDSLLFLGILFIISPIVQIWWTISRIHSGRRREKQLIERSVPGHGTVISLRETGLCTNDIPEVEIVLDVTTVTSLAYRVIHKEHVNPADLSSLFPGAVVKILVDALDKDRILLALSEER